MHQYRLYLAGGVILPVACKLDSYASERCDALCGAINPGDFFGVFLAPIQLVEA